jgi:hypothetical protein
MEKYSIAPNLISFTTVGSSNIIPYATSTGDMATTYVPETNTNKKTITKTNKPKAQGYTSAIKKLLK